MDILITGDAVFTGSELLRNGYVYIRDGRVEALGEGLPPEDATYASLVIGGPRRIIAPGIPWPVDPIGYLAKTPECTPEEIPCEARRALGPDEAKASLAAVLEAHTHGIAIPLLVVSSVSTVIHIAEMLGGDYGALIPRECGPAEPHPRIVAAREYDGGASVCIARDLCRSADPYERALEIARAHGLGDPVIREGEKAVVAVFDASRPPLLGTRIRSASEAGLIYGAGARAESLVVGEDILVEVGEHLMIVEKHVKEAVRIAGRLWGSEIEGDLSA